MEELELATSVASRRASSAEAELHRVKQQLELTDKRAKELAWQVHLFPSSTFVMAMAVRKVMSSTH